MPFLTRTKILGAIQGILLFFFSLYVESISNQRVIFIGKFLTKETNDGLLAKSWIVLLIFSLTMITLYVLSHYNRKGKAERLLYDRLCQHIFDQCIKKEQRFKVNDCKVTFLKVSSTIALKRDHPKDAITDGKAKRISVQECVVVAGRHQTKMGYGKSKVKFLKNEGCAGMCYANNLVVNKTISKYDVNAPQLYLDESLNELNLPRRKVKKLNEKPSSILCIPVCYFKSDKVMGVLSVDSISGTVFDAQTTRNIEAMITNYQAIFHNE